MSYISIQNENVELSDAILFVGIGFADKFSQNLEGVIWQNSKESKEPTLKMRRRLGDSKCY